MASGAAAVVEKPLCTTLEDADRLVRVVEAGGMLTYAENLLFADTTSTALSEVAALGPLHHLTARALQPRPTWGDFTRRHWGGGVLFDSLAVDGEGWICVATLGTTPGITAFSPDGSESEFFPTADPLTTNICFGGPEGRTAFVTLSGTGQLVAFDWPRPGGVLQFDE